MDTVEDILENIILIFSLTVVFIRLNFVELVIEVVIDTLPVNSLIPALLLLC